MKKHAAAISAALAMFALEGYGWGQRTRNTLPTVTLTVSMETAGPVESVSVDRRGGTVSLVISASAGGGFSGTISGTMTVAEPVNGDRIQLAQGLRTESYPFKLGPGDTTPSSCRPPVKNCFTVATSGGNDRTGKIVYTVTVDPSDQYSLNDKSFSQVTITVR